MVYTKFDRSSKIFSLDFTFTFTTSFVSAKRLPHQGVLELESVSQTDWCSYYHRKTNVKHFRSSCERSVWSECRVSWFDTWGLENYRGAFGPQLPCISSFLPFQLSTSWSPSIPWYLIIQSSIWQRSHLSISVVISKQEKLTWYRITILLRSSSFHDNFNLRLITRTPQFWELFGGVARFDYEFSLGWFDLHIGGSTHAESRIPRGYGGVSR